MADNTPDEAVGATSAYDPPQPTPAAVSSAALANQLRDFLSASDDDNGGAHYNAGVTETVTQTRGFTPVTFHTSGFGYTLPFNG
jgi:hypothetical protein